MQIWCTVSGGAYQDTREVSPEWNARPNHWCSPEFRCRMHPTVTQRPFSPPSFPARRKRRGRRRRVRNDHDGTNPCKQGFLSSVLVSSFPNRKLNLRFGFSYANLIQPLSLGCAEPASLKGEPRSAHHRKYSEAGDGLSVSLRLPAPLKGEPFLFQSIRFRGKCQGRG